MRLSFSLTAVLLILAPFAGCFGGGDSVKPATCDLKVTPNADGMTYLFDATNSTPADGTIAWTFGDGGVAAGPMSKTGAEEGLALIEYQYAITNALMHVSMVVRDHEGGACYKMTEVSLGSGNNTKPTVFLKNATRWVPPGGAVVLDASKSSDVDQDFFSYEWTLGAFSPDNTSVDTGYLSRGQSFNYTFEKEGVYDFHCHPHPWMKSRVIVSASDSNATGGGTIKIANFTYDPLVYTVTPGSSVTWVNDDPIEHTATTEMFAPGKIVHTGPVFSTRLETEGDFQAWLTLNDGKGGIVHQSWGMRASADSPLSPEQRVLFSANVNHVESAPAGNDFDQDTFPYKSNWTANLTATVTWDDPSTQGAGTAKIVLEKNGAVLTSCTVDGQSCTLQYNVEPTTYDIRLLLDGFHANNAVEITTSAIQWTFPSIGDSAGCPPGYDDHGPPHGCVKH